MDSFLGAYELSQPAEAIRLWLQTLPMRNIMMDTRWAWPTCESIHFLGLSLLIGTVGMFDLRLMGVGRKIPPAALHRLIRYGVAGFIMNVLTGLCFLSAAPDQYIYNPAFRWKVIFLVCAGLNILVFYSSQFKRVRRLGSGDPIPLGARMVGFASLSLWVGVITAGRLLTFFRPPQMF
ncbi:MAG: DUF6644 family protein [Acidobacteriota bacterium]